MPVEFGKGYGESAWFPGLEGQERLNREARCGFLQQAENGDCGDWRQSWYGKGEL